MTNIGNSPSKTPYRSTGIQQEPTSDDGKGRALSPASKVLSPVPASSSIHASDSKHVKIAHRPGLPEVVQPAADNYRSLDRQAGPRETHLNDPVRGRETLLRQKNSGLFTPKTKAERIRKKVKRHPSSLAISSLSSRNAHSEAEEESSAQSGLAASASNIDTEHLKLDKNELNRIRAERKGVKKAIKDAKCNQPLSAKLSWAAYAKHVQDEEKQKDLAERSLSCIPNANRAEIDDRKIYEYAYNSTHPEGASKAKGFQALGHRIGPGGFKPPIPDDVQENGETLKQQLKDGLATNTAVMRDNEVSYITTHGIAYNVTVPISGLNGKEEKAVEILTGWIDRR